VRHLLLVAAFAASTSAFAKSEDKYDFRFSPIGLVVGAIDVNLDIAIDPNWTLGPQIGFLHHKFRSDPSFTTDYDVKAFMLGARANWFRNGNYTDGLYVGPSLSFAGVKVETSDSNGPESASVSALLASCLVGYGWFWDSFNIMLGGGLTLGLGQSNVDITHSDGTKTSIATNIGGFDVEFSLGWTF
jgi:hypothetical protein